MITEVYGTVQEILIRIRFESSEGSDKPGHPSSLVGVFPSWVL